tara:strand:- start:222 stop:935 length:714 start_codon:yes stop_codon:yes gene_type:complete
MKNVGLILAAGKGTRLKTKNKKIFTLINNKTLVDHSIDNLKKIGLEVNVLINKKDRKYFTRTDCNFFFQNKALGTGHAVKILLKKIKKFKKCLIINADTPFVHEYDLRKALMGTISSHLCILGYLMKRNVSSGVFYKISKDKFVIKEYDLLNKNDKKSGLCNSGVIAFDKKISNEFFKIKKNEKKKEYLITDILEIISNTKYKTKIIKAKYPKLCQGVNTINDLIKIKNIVKKNTSL